MSKLLYSATMSLDGFIAGPDGDMSWLSEHVDAFDVDLDVLMGDVGALLIGRRTFGGDDPNAGTDAEGAYGGRWQGTSVVLTHDPPATPPADDVVFATELEEGVRLAQEAAGDRDVSILGANVAAQCLEAGVLDEILVFVAPVLLGDGTQMFEHPGGTNVRLEPLGPHPAGSGGLWYRVAR